MCADKLYPVEEIFTDKEIEDKKIKLQGDYVDKSLKLFFRVNDANEVIFPKCDCEGTKKPSVLSMWGSCFSVFNAIARDINILKKMANIISSLKHKEDFYVSNIMEDKAYSDRHPEYIRSYLPHYMLGNLYLSQGKIHKAQGCYNMSLNFLAKEIQSKKPDAFLKMNHDIYQQSKASSEEYDKAKKEFDKKPAIIRFLSAEPIEPFDYKKYLKYQQDFETYKLVQKMSEIYDKLALICEKKFERYPARVCAQASADLLEYNYTAQKIIERRKNDVQYIGDLYNEIKPD